MPGSNPYRVQTQTRASKIFLLTAVGLVAVLVALPAFASRSLIQDLFFMLTMLTLAQFWNLLAGYGGLVSIGQQAFVGIGAYAMFSLDTDDVDPHIPLAEGTIIETGVEQWSVMRTKKGMSSVNSRAGAPASSAPRLVRRNSPLTWRPRRRVIKSWCSTSSGGNSYSRMTLLYRTMSSALFRGQSKCAERGAGFARNADAPRDGYLSTDEIGRLSAAHDTHPNRRAAALLVSGGMTLPMIGKLLGHTQVQTTQRYAHLLDDPLRAGLEQVGEMLRAKPRLVHIDAA